MDYSFCKAILRLGRRAKRTNALLDQLIKGQEAIMGKIDEVKAIQDQDIQEGRESAAAGQAAVARLTSAVTALTEQVATLTAGQITDQQVAELKAASDAAKEQADAVQAAFDQAGA